MNQINKIETLVKVAVGTSAVTLLVTSTLFRKKYSNVLLENYCTKEALEKLNEHSGAKSILGEPIKPVSATTLDSSASKVKINVIGSKSTGILFFSVNTDKFLNATLDSVELQVGKDDTKRLVIKEAEPKIEKINC